MYKKVKNSISLGIVALSKNCFISSLNSLIFSKNIAFFSSSSAFFPNNIKGTPGKVREFIIGSITAPIFLVVYVFQIHA